MGVFGFGNTKNPVGKSKNMFMDQGITWVLSTVLILQALITVLHPIHDAETVTTAGKAKAEGYLYSPNFRYGDYYIPSDVSESDRQQRIRTGGTTDQKVKDSRRLISQSNYAVVILITGIWIRRSFRQICSNRKAFCKSLLALSIGGHAPPVKVY